LILFQNRSTTRSGSILFQNRLRRWTNKSQKLKTVKQKGENENYVSKSDLLKSLKFNQAEAIKFSVKLIVFVIILTNSFVFFQR
jgi:hypothetical protein